ncbi:hypothetical protein D3C76_1421510 [compost metagenome]
MQGLLHTGFDLQRAFRLLLIIALRDGIHHRDQADLAFAHLLEHLATRGQAQLLGSSVGHFCVSSPFKTAEEHFAQVGQFRDLGV